MAVLGNLFLNLFAAYIAAKGDIPVLKPATEFFKAHPTIIFSATVGVIVLFFVARVGHKEKETGRRLSAAFLICTPAEQLSREDLKFRAARPQEPETPETSSEKKPFYGTYIPRRAQPVWDKTSTDEEADMGNAEEGLAQLLRDRGRFLLLGAPGAGKTLTLFEILRRMTGYTVVSPKDSLPVPDEETFNLLKGRKVVILLDNLSEFSSDYNLRLFTERIEKATSGSYRVAGTCQDGGEINAIVNRHASKVTQFCGGLPKFHLPLMTDEDRIKLAETTGMPLSQGEARNYHLPGDITMRASTRSMRSGFHALEETQKDALRALKLLHTGGVRPTVSRVQSVLRDMFNRSIDQHSTVDLLMGLRNKFWLLKDPSTKEVFPNFGYLVNAVSYQEDAEPDEDHLAQALEKAQDVEALLYLSDHQARRGDLKRALQTVETALGMDAENAEGHFRRGYTLARLDRLDEALKVNQHALDLREDFAEAHNNRSYILFRLKEYPRALVAVQRALDLRENYDDAHVSKAKVLAQLGRFPEAEEEFQKARGIREKSYYLHLNWGITLSRQDAFGEALKAYEKALTLRPHYPEAYFNRGITLARMGKLEDALVAHDTAIAQREAYPEAHMHRGMTLFHLDRDAEAVEAHSRAIDLQDDYVLAYLNRGLTYAHMGEKYVEQAKKDGQAVLARGGVPLHSILGIAKSLGVNRAYTDALAMFNDIIARDPEFPEAYRERGITLRCLDRYKEALDDFDHAVKLGLDPAEVHQDRVETFVGRASMYVKNRDLENARADWKQIVKLEPDNPDNYLNLAITEGRLELYVEALANYHQADELRPNYAQGFFAEARTRCFYACKNAKEDNLGKAMDLLERAAAIDNGIIGQIQRKISAFAVLQTHPVYGDRLKALVWHPPAAT